MLNVFVYVCVLLAFIMYIFEQQKQQFSEFILRVSRYAILNGERKNQYNVVCLCSTSIFLNGFKTSRFIKGMNGREFQSKTCKGLF